MKKSQKIHGLIAMIAVALFIDFIVLFGSNLSWGPKLVITGISVLGQIVAIWATYELGYIRVRKVRERLFFDLSAKLYTVLIFCSKHFLYSRDLGCDPKRKSWY